MDDEAEIVKAGVQATVQSVFAPFNELITNLLGPVTEEIGLDLRSRYAAYRTARTTRLLGRVQEGFDLRQGEVNQVPPKLLAAVLDNGSLEEDDTLQDRWAALIINAGPSMHEQQLLLNSAPEFLKQLNKWEIMLLEMCMKALEPDDYMPLPVPARRSQLETVRAWSWDLRRHHGFDLSGMRYGIDFQIMVQNLIRLRLLKAKEENGNEVDYFLTTLGYHFVLLCSYPKPWVQPAPRKQRFYLQRWVLKHEGEGDIQMAYSGSAQGAASWERPEDAEAYVREINEDLATFNTDAQRYEIANPRVEKREDGKFIVSCDV